MVNKRHWDTVKNYIIHEGSGTIIGHDEAKKEENSCDHELISITP